MKFVEAVNRLAPSFQGELHLDPTTRKVYATDASVYQEMPAAVAIPKTVEDLQRLIQLAHQTGVGADSANRRNFVGRPGCRAWCYRGFVAAFYPHY